MKTEDLFDDDFLKQFKTGDELTNFLKEIQKRGRLFVQGPIL